MPVVSRSGTELGLYLCGGDKFSPESTGKGSDHLILDVSRHAEQKLESHLNDILRQQKY